ncbi:MAG: sugar transferase [Chloracidobacterium sp.]|nr:sugar transferase [Chloracidobacterium sp.]MDW8216563.1 sugar transferase [Acidobacteriota bacterium]
MAQTTLPPLGSSSSPTAVSFVRPLLSSVGDTTSQFFAPIVIAGLVLFDTAAATGSLAAGIWIASAFWQVEPTLTPYVPFLPTLLLVRLLTLRHYGLYRLRGAFRYSDDLLAAFKGVSLGCIYSFVTLFFFHRGMLDQPLFLSRVVFVCDWAILLVLVVASRILLRQVQSWVRSEGYDLIPAFVVGIGEEARVCIAEINESPRLGYKVLGVLTTDERTPDTPDMIEDVPIIGTFDDLPELARALGIKEVLITDSQLHPRRIFNAMMNAGRKHHLNFRVVPSLFNCLPEKTQIEQLGSLPMIQLFRDPLSGVNRFLKRALDVVGASVGLIVLSPVLAAIAIAIRRESPGPIFYRQERVGMDGRTFQMLKFRSMYADATDEIHRRLMVETIRYPSRANRGTRGKPLYGKVFNDPRLTKVGKWIRRYSLDELPNLWNVLKGEMSLVGPRPPIPYEVAEYEDWHRARFSVKGGVTGLWQVSGRNRLTFEQMVRLDIYYIENWSLWLDIKILLRTIPVVLRGDNTY